MNLNEYLLICLAEEGAEVSQAASKVLRFGDQDKRNNESLTNIEELFLEVIDVWATLEVLLGKENIALDPKVKELIDAKKLKISQYVKISSDLGRLQAK
jgi:hypothetical protein